MFETHDQAEIPFPSELCDPGEQAWSYVRTRLHVVYSLTHEEEGERHTLREMMFLTRVAQLQPLREAGTQIVAIDLMSPGHLKARDAVARAPGGDLGRYRAGDRQSGGLRVRAPGRAALCGRGPRYPGR